MLLNFSQSMLLAVDFVDVPMIDDSKQIVQFKVGLKIRAKGSESQHIQGKLQMECLQQYHWNMIGDDCLK